MPSVLQIKYYIATYSGLYQSLDNGHTLTPVEGLPGQANVAALAFGHDIGINGYKRLVIYVGTTGGYRVANDTAAQAVSLDVMGAGIYRSSVVFHYLYFPLIMKK